MLSPRPKWAQQNEKAQSLILLRLIAWLFFLLTFMALGAELLYSLQRGGYQALTVTTLWNTISPASLQSFINNVLPPALFDVLKETFFRRSVWLWPLILSGLFFLLGRMGGSRRSYGRRVAGRRVGGRR